MFAALLLTIGGALLFYRYEDILRDLFLRRITFAAWPAVPYGRKLVPRPSARFTEITGTVHTKAEKSKFWVDATLDTTLGAPQLVETGAEGAGAITFVDGITGRLAPNTVIQIQKNETDAGKHTHLLLELTAGQADLSVGTQNAGCNVRVTVGDATVLVLSGSRVLLGHDPRAHQQEVTVREGRAEVLRPAGDVSVTANEEVRFADGASSPQPLELPAAPRVLAPEEGSTLIIADPSSRVRLQWEDVAKAPVYRLRISHDSYFQGEVFQRDVRGTEIALASLPPGDYYWTIQAISDAGTESLAGEPRRFTVSSQRELALSFQATPGRQRTVEITGRTEPGTRLLVNGSEVAVDGSGVFRYSTPPLPAGAQIISVTAQNAAGAVVTRQAAVEVR